MSEGYVALYRRYRPRAFAEVVGQEAVTESLQASLCSGRFAHAYLFCGPRGTGKTSMARLLARAVNCADLRDGEPCGECAICEAFLAGRLVDVHEIDAASNRRIAEMRDLLDQVAYTPTQCRYKVYILDEAHMLTADAANAFLKTLEEPPPHVLFVLATTEAHKILPTISSRCQVYEFRKIGEDACVRLLEKIAREEGAELGEGVARFVAMRSGGAMRDALALLERLLSAASGPLTREAAVSALGLVPEGILVDLATALARRDSGQVYRALDEVATQGRDTRRLLMDLVCLLRDVLRARCGVDEALGAYSPAAAEQLRGLERELDENRLLSVLARLDRGLVDARAALLPDFSVELCLLEALHLDVIHGRDQLEVRLAALEEGGVVAPAPGAAPAPVPVQAREPVRASAPEREAAPSVPPPEASVRETSAPEPPLAPAEPPRPPGGEKLSRAEQLRRSLEGRKKPSRPPRRTKLPEPEPEPQFGSESEAAPEVVPELPPEPAPSAAPEATAEPAPPALQPEPEPEPAPDPVPTREESSSPDPRPAAEPVPEPGPEVLRSEEEPPLEARPVSSEEADGFDPFADGPYFDEPPPDFDEPPSTRVLDGVLPPPARAETPPVPAPAPPREDLGERWHSLLDRARKEHPITHGALREASLRRGGDGVLEVFLEADFSFHHGRLREPQHRSVLTHLLGGLFGEGVEYRLVLEGEEGSSGRSSSRPRSPRPSPEPSPGRLATGAAAPPPRKAPARRRGPARGRDWYEDKVLQDPVVQSALETFEGEVHSIE